MFNENKIKENRVCYLDGRADGLSDLLRSIQIKNRKTISVLELAQVIKQEQAEYEKAWNKWADENNIGGDRFDETGCQKKRGL